MNLNQMNIIVSNVPQVCADLEHILDKRQIILDDSFAQFTIGSHCLMLSENHLIPLENFSQESSYTLKLKILGTESKAFERIRVEILHSPYETDWETESLLVKGPAGLVIDFYRMK